MNTLCIVLIIIGYLILGLFQCDPFSGLDKLHVILTLIGFLIIFIARNIRLRLYGVCFIISVLVVLNNGLTDAYSYYGSKSALKIIKKCQHTTNIYMYADTSAYLGHNLSNHAYTTRHAFQSPANGLLRSLTPIIAFLIMLEAVIRENTLIRIILIIIAVALLGLSLAIEQNAYSCWLNYMNIMVGK